VEDLLEPLALFLVAMFAALVGVEAGRRRLVVFAKPLCTLSLGAVAYDGKLDLTTTLVLGGLGFSLLGDVALLFEGDGPFLAGLVLFLVAHLAYVGAFVYGGVGPLWTPVVGLAVFSGAAGWLVKQIWPRVGMGMRGAVMFYAAAITAMAATAFATLAGGWPPEAAGAAAFGALFFFLSDASLAWARFVSPFRHAPTFILFLYWVGQLGIALAARWSAG
jgi:uncharacterized membrane protein YhhN